MSSLYLALLWLLILDLDIYILIVQWKLHNMSMRREVIWAYSWAHQERSIFIAAAAWLTYTAGNRVCWTCSDLMFSKSKRLQMALVHQACWDKSVFLLDLRLLKHDRLLMLHSLVCCNPVVSISKHYILAPLVGHMLSAARAGLGSILQMMDQNATVLLWRIYSHTGPKLMLNSAQNTNNITHYDTSNTIESTSCVHQLPWSCGKTDMNSL